MISVCVIKRLIFLVSCQPLRDFIKYLSNLIVQNSRTCQTECEDVVSQSDQMKQRICDSPPMFSVEQCVQVFPIEMYQTSESTPVCLPSIKLPPVCLPSIKLPPVCLPSIKLPLVSPPTIITHYNSVISPTPLSLSHFPQTDPTLRSGSESDDPPCQCDMSSNCDEMPPCEQTGVLPPCEQTGVLPPCEQTGVLPPSEQTSSISSSSPQKTGVSPVLSETDRSDSEVVIPKSAGSGSGDSAMDADQLLAFMLDDSSSLEQQLLPRNLRSMSI